MTISQRHNHYYKTLLLEAYIIYQHSIPRLVKRSSLKCHIIVRSWRSSVMYLISLCYSTLNLVFAYRLPVEPFFLNLDAGTDLICKCIELKVKLYVLIICTYNLILFNFFTINYYRGLEFDKCIE